MESSLLRMHGIVKTFPGVRALDGVDLDVRAGEVHCLLGQNGAGKSTLIKVLAGAHQPDEGTITWQGEEVRLATPQASTRQGIATMYQELDLVPGLSVAENVFLGHETSRFGITLTRARDRRTRELLAQLGHPEISPDREVGDLSAAGQQVVSMARALSRDAQVIVMDEPSAVLDSDEVANLFRVVRSLTAAGVAVIYISHRLEEIREIGDRVTVLKDGRTVAENLSAQDTPTADVIRLMTGKTLDGVFPERTGGLGDVVLDVADLACAGSFSGVSLQIRAGEIVGLAGLVGAGRSEILETIFGARRATAGSVRVDGRRLRPGSVKDAVRAHVGLAPEERKSQALVMQQSIASNITLASLTRFSRGGFIDFGGEQKRSDDLAGDLDLRPVDVSRLVSTLSGGNQQKVVLARWLLRECRVLLLDEPTRGVDVGARKEIYDVVRRLADSGVAVLVVSSEVPEVLGLADRVLVVREGRVVHTGPASELDESRVLDLVMSEEHQRSRGLDPQEGDAA
ncbi:sugar ABC transporter ATP-binding protein [Jannaschia sp. R86511]|uniref:sugar ABC transporter ATP-binding protein n=1 Tax=Jannaschia sp. R86511 TaxID=3093853 RepID=UPI0036D3E166